MENRLEMLLDKLDMARRSDHFAMCKAKVRALTVKERRVLCKHYFGEVSGRIEDLAEALMYDPKSPLFYEEE